MSKKEKLNQDPRIGEILNLILQIAGGNLEARAVPSEQGDDLDAIISGLNMLVEEIKSMIEFELQAKARSEAAISEMVDVIMEVARGNYSAQVELSDKNDDLDSLAVGLNMMIDDVRNAITERKRAEEALLERTHDLGERVKELGCLNGALKLIAEPDKSTDEVLQGIVHIIQQSWQYPEITCARIIFKENHFQTENFNETAWVQSADISVFEGKVGSVEVYYLKEKPTINEGPFLKEERNLIDALAREVGKFIEHQHMEKEKEKFAYDLNERMKEFRCLYSIANSIRSERSFEELLVDSTKYIKEAWQYPEITRSKIRFNGQDYKSIEFKETKYKLAADIVVRGETRGAIEVYYLKEMPESDEGPFLNEERKLLDEIASYLGTYAGKIEMEEERIAMESRLNQAQRLKAVGQLSTGIAHEINTPLQYLGDNLRFLEDANDKMTGLLKSQGLAIPTPEEDRSSPGAIETTEDRLGINDVDYLIEEVPSAIRQSLEGVEYISKIVQAMKIFAQPGVEGTTAIDINEAIESTVEVSRNEWKSAADVELNLDPNIPQIQCVPSEINQAILAVLLNAAQAIEDFIGDQATDEKGTISISTHREGDEVEIRIEDTGTGIPEDIQPHVFEPFFTTRDVGQGSGQGLTIAYSIIVEGHDGSITFKTEEGKGTTFFIRLPILP